MSERERQRRAEQSRSDRDGSYTLSEWCDHRRISKAMFYKMPGPWRPRTHNAGAKVLISHEADLDWVAAREAESQNSAA
jgi:hypothetical protein